MNRADVALHMNSTCGVSTLDETVHELSELAHLASQLAIIAECIGPIPYCFLTECVSIQAAIDLQKQIGLMAFEQIQRATICFNAQRSKVCIPVFLLVLSNNLHVPEGESILSEDEHALSTAIEIASAWVYALWFHMQSVSSTSDAPTSTRLYQTVDLRQFAPPSSTKEQIRTQTSGIRHGPPSSFDFSE